MTILTTSRCDLMDLAYWLRDLALCILHADIMILLGCLRISGCSTGASLGSMMELDQIYDIHFF